jgi:hypothetical protein
MSSTLILPFARTITPEGLHTVQHSDNEAAARQAASVQTWRPAEPPPEPAVVQKLRKSAAAKREAELLARQDALNAEGEADARKHAIANTQAEIKTLENEIGTLEAMDFTAEGKAAEAQLRAGIGQANTSWQFNQLFVSFLRTPHLAKWQPQELTRLRANLAELKTRLAGLESE